MDLEKRIKEIIYFYFEGSRENKQKATNDIIKVINKKQLEDESECFKHSPDCFSGRCPNCTPESIKL